MRDWLRKRWHFYGDMRDAGFEATLGEAIDPAEMEKTRRWRRVYLARYMRMPPRDCDDTAVSELNAYVAIVSDFLKKEATPLTNATETDFT